MVSLGDLFDREVGLPGSILLADRMNVSLARGKRLARRVAVVALEADPLVPVADVAAELVRLVRPDDTVARLAGGVFVVVCNGVQRDEHAEHLRIRLASRSHVVRSGVHLATGDHGGTDAVMVAVSVAGIELPPSYAPWS